jgi:PAS domain S-box-containing protein
VKRVSLKIMNWLAGTLIGIVVTLPAVSYYVVSYNQMKGQMRAESEIEGAAITRIINRNPQMWEFEDARIREVIWHEKGGIEQEFHRVANRENETVLAVGDKPGEPAMMHSRELLDFGEPAGRFEIIRSLRPALARSGAILLILWSVGATLFLRVRKLLGDFALEAERDIRAGEKKFRSLFNEALDMIHIVSHDGRILDVNPMELKTLGYKKKELVGRPLMQIIHPEFRAQVEESLPRVLKGEKVRGYQTVMITKGGERVDVEVNAVPQIRAGKVVAARAIIRDVTEREGSQRELFRHQKQLQSLASALVSAEERERRNLAAVLHDDIGQLLAMCKHKIESDPAFRDDNRVRDARSARTLLTQAIDRTRSLTWELSSQTLYDLGLLPAVEELCAALEERHGIRLTVSCRGSHPIPEAVLGTVYRSVREMLYNVIRHAGATHAEVSIVNVDSTLKVSVSDDGIGFDETDLAQVPAPTGRFGLFNIKERISDFGGRLDIGSVNGKGARVSLSVRTDTDFTD